MDKSALRQSLVRVLDTDNEVYSGRMAFVFCMGISALLWWIPLLGPAVAGYVCGRKAGSMVKGFFCSVISGIVLSMAVLGLSALILAHGGYPDVPADEAAASLEGVVGIVASYLQTFFTQGTPDLNLVSLCVVAVFGAVGGILSRQMRKETAYLLSVGAVEGSVRPIARSMQLYSQGKKLGFETFGDCMTVQGMDTNINRDTKAEGRNHPAQGTRQREMKPAVTTVQTVTTTVSDDVSARRKGSSEDPFADILERSPRNRNGP
ncbi:MAG: hypothetical protein LBU30_03265 [Candidatus Methanoplasma sp.]|jgi:hypothetical protein|nr:hypothetical protein [Candidatus Methanoplasma sp.]